MASKFSWTRVYALLLRHWYGTLRSFDRLTDSFYWIALDLILWGITAGYMQENSTKDVNIFFMITSSVIMWNIVYRAQIDIGIGLLEELWNKNLINLFASPLSLREWMTSLVIFSICKTIIAVAFGTFLAMVLYNFFFLQAIGWYLIPFFIVLVMTGWWVGLLVVSVILRLTTKAQAVAWTFVWVLAPFSAIYFPLTSLPAWAQSVSTIVPSSYVFEEMRSVINGGTLNWRSLVVATILNIIYLSISLVLVKKSFTRTLERGLVKVY